MKHAFKISVFLFLICIFAIWVIIDSIYDNQLNNAHIKFVTQFQKHNSSSVKTIFLIITQFGYSYVILPIFILYYEWNQSKLEALSFFSVYSFGNYLVSIIKLGYGRPRPYWISSDVIAINCSKGFGNPSGHAFTGGFLLLYLAIKFFSLFQNPKIMELLKYRLLFIIFSGICFSLSILVGFSRIYLGVHFFSQVIYGFLLGLIFCWAHSCFYDFFYLNEVFQLMMSKNYKQKLWYVFIFLIFTLVMILILILIYQLEYSNYQIDSSWVFQIQTKCPSVLKSDDKFQDSSLYDASTLFIPLSLITGGFFNYNSEYQKDEKIFWKNYLKLTLFKKILRLVIYGSLVAAIYFPLNLQSSKSNGYILFFFREGLISILLGFLLISFIPLIFHGFNISVEGDYNKYVSKKNSHQKVSLKKLDELENINNNSEKDHEMYS